MDINNNKIPQNNNDNRKIKKVKTALQKFGNKTTTTSKQFYQPGVSCLDENVWTYIAGSSLLCSIYMKQSKTFYVVYKVLNGYKVTYWHLQYTT